MGEWGKSSERVVSGSGHKRCERERRMGQDERGMTSE